MRTITLADPALTSTPTAWSAARADLTARAGELRDRGTPPPHQEPVGPGAGSLGDEEPMTEDTKPDADKPDTDAGGDTAAATPRPVGQRSYLDRERSRRTAMDAAGRDEAEAELSAAEAELSTGEAEPRQAEQRQAEQRPRLRRERALDPDWIGARPLFRDEAPARPMPRIEFEPSAGAGASRKPPHVAPMRSVVLGAKPDAGPMPEPEPEPDPPTLIDRMPPIDPDDLAVPDFLRADFAQPAPAPAQAHTRAPAQPKPKPQPRPVPHPDPPTLVDPHPAVPAGDISVPDFIVPGFATPAPKPPLRTVLSTVLGPELWERCYAEWSAAHCTALARIARAVDGLAPSAGTAVRSTAGAGMRWLGVARERATLAEMVAEAISHPPGATATNRARTVRLYGAAICVALNLPLRRCACHRDLERDVSGELIRLGLEELAGEVP